MNEHYHEVEHWGQDIISYENLPDGYTDEMRAGPYNDCKDAYIDLNKLKLQFSKEREPIIVRVHENKFGGCEKLYLYYLSEENE